MARRLRRIVSIILTSALFVCSAGFDAQRAAAQTLSGRAGSVSPTPQLGLGLDAPAANLSISAPALTLSAPSLSAPSALPGAPVPLVRAVSPALAAKAPALAAASVSDKIKAVAPALAVLASPKSGVSAASAAGRDLENALTGGRSIGAGEISAVAGAESAVVPALTPALSAASAPEAPKAGDSVPAAKPAAPKSIASATSYSVHRLALKAVALLTGAVFTMPQAGDKLTAKIIASAADKRLVLSDFDDTLAGYNEVLPQQKVEAVAAIRKAGKHFAVISDRGDVKRPGATQLTVFESLDSLPVSVRAGMYVAANSGGKVYRYDEKGQQQLVHEAAGLTDEQTAKIKEAAAATKARLSEVGAVQHEGDGKNPAESFNTYGYAIMLKPGSSQDAVKGAAKILNEELAKRGFEVEVQPRFAKSPENPPYATFSIITKADAAKYIAGALKVEAKDALVIGDAMFIPRDAKKASWLSRMGERLSGRPQVKTGNETDRNMEKGLPGVLALGVGGAMDPRVPNGWALAGHGPEVTQKVLEAVASKPAGDGKDGGSSVETAMHLGLVGLIVGLGALGWYAMFHAIGDLVQMAERAIHDWNDGPFGEHARFFLGSTALGVVGMIGRSHAHPSLLPEPKEGFALALKAAREIAVARGAKAEDVRFIEATASRSSLNGGLWLFSFTVPSAKGGTDLVYADAGGTARIYEGAAAAGNAVPFAMNEYLFAKGTGISPEAAIDLLREALPGLGAGLSVSLAVEEKAESGDKDAWYRFYDDKGNAGAVNGRTGEVRVDKTVAAAKAAPSGMKHAVEPNELYALALENVRAKAAPGAAIRFLSAVHEARYFNGAWVGDEWRFRFGVAGKDGGLEYMVPARRTMITETMMDAFEPRLVGALSAAGMAGGVEASLFGTGVKVTPESALASVDGVSRVALEPRVDPVSGDKDLWYSLQGDRRELASVNARTGEVRKDEPKAPGSALRSFLLWLAGAALVAAVYGGFFWAASHAPAAAPQGLPEGYNGPMPTVDDVFRGLGGALGLAGVAGMIGFRAPDFLRSPADDYAAAFKAAAESVKAKGVAASDLRFAGATANTRVSEGRHWSYTFTYPVKDGVTGLLYVDMTRQFLGSEMEARVTRYPSVPTIGETLRSDLVARAVSVGAVAALDLVRKDHPEFGSDASVSLTMIKDAVTGDADLWYTFYDNDGGRALVNARTGEAKLEAAPAPGVRAADGAKALRLFLLVAAVAAIAAAIIAHFAPAGMLGLGLIGAIKAGGKGRKAKVTDDEIRAAVKSVVAWKGGTWSQTEYNMGYSNVYDGLVKRGATKRQLELFKKLCDEAPVIGGRFNPWSGD